MLRRIPVLALLVAFLFSGFLPHVQAAVGVDCHWADTGSTSPCNTPASGDDICTLPGSGACQVPVIEPGDLIVGTTWPDVIPATLHRSGYHSPVPAGLYRPPISALI